MQSIKSVVSNDLNRQMDANEKCVNEKREAKQNQKYELIDILKFVCAIFVIGIHTNIMNNPSDTFEWYVLHIVFRIAVPIFFVCSGFLFGKKYFADRTKLKELCIKQEKRLVKPFIFWLLISLPFIIITAKAENFSVLILDIVKQVVFYPWGALWFVLAVMVAIGISYVFLKYKKERYALYLAPILFGIALLGNSYYFVIENTPIQSVMDFYLNIFISTRNGIFVGFPLFIVGLYLAKKEVIIDKISSVKLFSCLSLALAVQICEVTFIRYNNYNDDHSLFISTVFIAAIVLAICIKYKNVKFKKINTTLLRNLSTGIYFMHRPLISYIFLLNLNIGRWYLFIFVTSFSIFVCYILNKLNNKYINYIIK